MHQQPTVGGYAVTNTVRALERLSLGPHSAPELADHLRIDVRTARRLLKRFAAEGYVAQEGGHRRRYRATFRLVALGGQLLARAALPRLAAPELARLAVATGCVARLWVPAGSDALCVLRAVPGAPATASTGGPARTSEREAAAHLLARDPDDVGPIVRRAREESVAVATVSDCDAAVAALGISGTAAADAVPLVAYAADALTVAMVRVAADTQSP